MLHSGLASRSEQRFTTWKFFKAVWKIIIRVTISHHVFQNFVTTIDAQFKNPKGERVAQSFPKILGDPCFLNKISRGYTIFINNLFENLPERALFHTPHPPVCFYEFNNLFLLPFLLSCQGWRWRQSAGIRRSCSQAR